MTGAKILLGEMWLALTVLLEDRFNIPERNTPCPLVTLSDPKMFLPVPPPLLLSLDPDMGALSCDAWFKVPSVEDLGAAVDEIDSCFVFPDPSWCLCCSRNTAKDCLGLRPKPTSKVL